MQTVIPNVAGNIITTKSSCFADRIPVFGFHKTKPQINIKGQILVNTDTLMNTLDCGRHTAIEIGKQAGAKVCIGRKLFWNVKRIQQYVDDIAE